VDDPVIEDMSDVIAVPPMAEREQGFTELVVHLLDLGGLFDHLLIEGETPLSLAIVGRGRTVSRVPNR
jgi:hypothetical protein